MKLLTENSFNKIALALSIAGIFICWLVAEFTFERIPHIEDEMAYSWQAQTIARGDLILESPISPRSFLVPFVIDYNGYRFSKYPPGWPAVLSLGVRLGLRDWVNPLLAGFSLWLTYLTVKRITTPGTAFIAQILMLTSPFFLLNSGSLLSHPWSLFLSLSTLLAWMEFTKQEQERINIAALFIVSISIGLLILTRPLTAIAVAFPFFFHGIYILIKRERRVKVSILLCGIMISFFALMYPLWQFALTGDFWLNPYTLWWNYDRIGFGVGIGTQTGGYQLDGLWQNMQINYEAGATDLFGWGNLSLIILPFGLISLWKKAEARLAISIIFSLIIAYMFYWIGSWLYGPRYYYEGLVGLVLLTSAGFSWLAGNPLKGDSLNGKKAIKWTRYGLTCFLAIFLIGFNLLSYLPNRLANMHGLYGATRSRLEPFQTQSFLNNTPAVIFLHIQQDWIEYGSLLELSSPYFDSPFVFALSRSIASDYQASLQFPERSVWHYYPDQPDQIFSGPQ